MVFVHLRPQDLHFIDSGLHFGSNSARNSHLWLLRLKAGPFFSGSKNVNLYKCRLFLLLFNRDGQHSVSALAAAHAANSAPPRMVKASWGGTSRFPPSSSTSLPVRILPLNWAQ